MADDQFDARGDRETPAWFESFRAFELFRTFRIAVDPRNLFIAAVGILIMALGWWVISWGFYRSQPEKHNGYILPSDADFERKYPDPEVRAQKKAAKQIELDQEFDEAVDRWLLLHYLAGSGEATATKSDGSQHRVWGGKLRTLPWLEDRGPNPYLLITGRDRPWEQSGFVGWFVEGEVPVLLEPLIKFLEPVVYITSPRAGTYTRFYLLVIILWTLATWAFFGGVLTRKASVELAGKESIGVKEAIRFVMHRYLSYLFAPSIPFGFIAVLVFIAIIFGLFHLIPYVGDIVVSGLLWAIPLVLGLGIALLLAGLVGYPMMFPTISVEGSDALDAFSRSYNYVAQAPLQYFCYALFSLLYGAVAVFFVGLIGSLAAYLGAWAVSNTPAIESAKRSPQYLFIHTPTSFGWRQLLLTGSPGEQFVRLEEQELALLRLPEDQKRAADFDTRLADVRNKKLAAEQKYNEWLGTAWSTNPIGSWMVALWVTLLFLMVLGFGYSFFWTASTMIYLLMRRKVDDTDMDEIYLEEEETEDIYGAPATTLPMTAPADSGSGKMELVDLNVKTDKPPAPPPESGPPPVPPANESPPPVN